MRPFLVIALAISLQACDKGPPSREDVFRILTAEFPRYVMTQDSPVGYVTDADDKPFGNGPDWMPHERSKECLDRLASAGLISSPRRTPGHWMRWGSKFYVWAYEPTATDVTLLAEAEDMNGFKIPMARFLIAVPELLGVTGITEPATNLGTSGPMVTANFNYRWTLAPAGSAFAGEECIIDPPPIGQREGEAIFVKYDDGWRLENLSSPGRMTL